MSLGNRLGSLLTPWNPVDVLGSWGISSNLNWLLSGHTALFVPWVVPWVAFVILSGPPLGTSFDSESCYNVVMKVVDIFRGSHLVCSQGAFLGSNTGRPVGLQSMFYILPGSKVRYPNVVVSPLQSTLVVSPAGSCAKFSPYFSVTCPNYSLLSTLDVPLSVAGPNVPWWTGCIQLCRKAKGNNEVEIKVEGLVEVVIFVIFSCCYWFFLYF